MRLIITALLTFITVVLSGIAVVAAVSRNSVGDVLSDPGRFLPSSSSFGPIFLVTALLAFVAAVVTGSLALGVWRSRRWAWIGTALLGAAAVFGAWIINQSFYGDGLLALTPWTPILAPIAVLGALLLAASVRWLRSGGGTPSDTAGLPE